MLKVIYGPDDSDRDDFAYKKIASELKNDRTVWVLVPEQFSLSTERAVIKMFGISAQTRIKVITFSRLCSLVLSARGPLRMRYIDGAGRQIIAARVIRRLKGRLKVLAGSLSRRGFSSDIVELVSEFKRYGISADMLKSAAETESDEILSDKLLDISEILDLFNMFLETKAADAEDDLALVLPKIKDCGFLGGSLYIMHFRSFTPLEYSVIGELMQKMDVYAVMCCDDIYKSSSLFVPVAETCMLLEKTAVGLGVACGESVKFKSKDCAGDIAYLRHNYFEGRPIPRMGDPEGVKIYSLSGNYRETEAAADLILRLCRTEGRRLSDFLILARNTENYSRIMPAVFESRGIDVFLDTRRSVLANPLTDMICAVLDIAAYGYSYDRVMTIARSGMTGLSDCEIDLFENYLLAVNPSHEMWEREEWTYMPKGYNAEEINRIRAALTGMPCKLMNSLQGRKTAGGICTALQNCLSEDKTVECIERMCDEFSQQGMPYLADEYRQVLDGIVSTVYRISSLMDEESITWRDFAELFKSACGGLSVGLTPQTQGSVAFSAIDKFRTEGVPVVIVLGMTDGIFPRAHTTEGLLSDAERAELQKAGLRLAPGADAKRREEQLFIYSVLSAAKERLYLFVPETDNNGDKLAPSPIIKRIMSKIFPEIKLIDPDRCDDVLNLAEGRAAAFEVLCSRLAAAEGRPEMLSGSGKELYSYFESCEEYKEILNGILRAMEPASPEKLSREAVEAIYGKTIMLSASKLERFNACAFAYFMRYGLLAAERERAGVEPRSMGSIQHAALYRYFTMIKESGEDYAGIKKEECFFKVAEIVKDEAIKSEELLYEGSAYYKYVVTRMQGIAARTAWEVVKFYRSSAFRPAGFEIRIDTGGEIPAVSIKNSRGKEIARIRGIIDRADYAVINGKTYISVVDYKSSQKALDEKLAAAGVNIQPLMYADIICKRLSASPAAMLYMQMTDPIVNESKLREVTEQNIERAVNDSIALKGWMTDNAAVVAGYSTGGENGEKYIPGGKSALVSESEMQRRIDAANQKIKQAAREIYSGKTEPNPYTEGDFNACEYCAFAGACGRLG